MAPAVLQLMEIEPPTELAAALSADFLDRLRIANPPPVRIATPPENATWRGYCSATDFSECGEVVLADWRQPREWLILQRIQGIYMHETAHRLIFKTDNKVDAHGIEFFAVLLFLFHRAGLKRSGLPWLVSADLYDCHDALESRGIDGIPSTGESVDFALELAADLAPQEITAEAAAEEICRRAKFWKNWKAAEPNRRAAAKEKYEAAQVALKETLNKIFWWRVYFSASSFLAAAFLILAICMR